MAVDPQLRVTVWGENVHERREQEREEMAGRYPTGMHGAIADGIRSLLGAEGLVRTATLNEPENGLDEATLAETDVLVWWGHVAHAEVADEIVDRVQRCVLGGMGLLVLHSGHFSKIFRSLMGTTCTLAWRDSGDSELVWTIDPDHPIAEGVPQPIFIAEHETYCERFDVPAPEELVFISSFSSGAVFRSGCTWRRGRGKVFYFSLGDQAYPIYHHPDVQRVLANAVRWAAPEPLSTRIPHRVTNMQERPFARQVGH